MFWNRYSYTACTWNSYFAHFVSNMYPPPAEVHTGHCPCSTIGGGPTGQNSRLWLVRCFLNLLDEIGGELITKPHQSCKPSSAKELYLPHRTTESFWQKNKLGSFVLTLKADTFDVLKHAEACVAKAIATESNDAIASLDCLDVFTTCKTCTDEY